MYESELAPETYRETARQHPREIPVISEKHVLSSSVNCNAEQEKEKTTSPNKTITETVTERLAPAYAAVSDATYALASKVQGLTISTPAASQTTSREAIAPQPLPGQTVPQTYSGTSVPQTYSSSFAPEIGTHANTSEQIWDKGVSVKEYLMHKLEPGEDERALSQVISEAMSPRSRRTPGDIGVVEKVREAVTSLLWHEESPKYTAANSAKSTTSHLPISTNAHLAKNSASHIPISTNVHEGNFFPFIVKFDHECKWRQINKLQLILLNHGHVRMLKSCWTYLHMHEMIFTKYSIEVSL